MSPHAQTKAGTFPRIAAACSGCRNTEEKHSNIMHVPASFRRLAPCCLGAILASALALPAHAAGVVGTGTPASCTQAALVAAAAGGGLVTFNCGAAPHTIVYTLGTLGLNTDTTIDGGGLITLDGNQTRALIVMDNALNLTLTGLTLARGLSPGSGGAIYAVGPSTLTLTDVNLTDNEAAQNGGAIVAHSGVALNLTRVRASGNRAGIRGGAIITLNRFDTITLNQFVASGNQAVSEGGAIHHRGEGMSIDNSLFTGNSAGGNGGGAINLDPAVAATQLTVTNSTFHANTVANGASGSAIRARSAVGSDIVFSTFANNSGGDAIRAWDASSIMLRGSIVANTVGQPNCVTQNTATIIDGGNNLQFGGSAAQSCGAAAVIPELDPLLAPLANNGGFSYTMALLAGSPAIDTHAGIGCPAADQRGVARPIGAACDIGAHEGPPAPPVVPPGPGGAGAVSVPVLDAGALALLALLLPVAAKVGRRRG